MLLSFSAVFTVPANELPLEAKKDANLSLGKFSVICLAGRSGSLGTVCLGGLGFATMPLVLTLALAWKLSERKEVTVHVTKI